MHCACECVSLPSGGHGTCGLAQPCGLLAEGVGVPVAVVSAEPLANVSYFSRRVAREAVVVAHSVGVVDRSSVMGIRV